LSTIPAYGYISRAAQKLLMQLLNRTLLGPGKLPELGSSIGKAIRGFKKAMEEPEHKPEDTTDTKKSENK
jgi:hypothetical protein